MAIVAHSFPGSAKCAEFVGRSILTAAGFFKPAGPGGKRVRGLKGRPTSPYSVESACR